MLQTVMTEFDVSIDLVKEMLPAGLDPNVAVARVRSSVEAMAGAN
jgi:hypothetical protein